MTDEATRLDVTTRMDAYLAVADRLLPGWITDVYVVGSAALGEYRPGRSDVDFVAVVDAPASPAQLRVLRAVHLRVGASVLRRSGLGGEGMPNGVFVGADDIAKPVTTIAPVASHTGIAFSVGRGFDVNPVMWRVLATNGIRIRGREARTLGLDTQPELLTQWNIENLRDYWRPLGTRFVAGHARRTLAGLRYGHGWAVEWATLGPPRLHHTIGTGEVIGKRSAGEYALDTFDSEWHPVISLGLDRWHRAGTACSAADARRAGEFAIHVVDSVTG